MDVAVESVGDRLFDLLNGSQKLQEDEVQAAVEELGENTESVAQSMAQKHQEGYHILSPFYNLQFFLSHLSDSNSVIQDLANKVTDIYLRSSPLIERKQIIDGVFRVDDEKDSPDLLDRLWTLVSSGLAHTIIAGEQRHFFSVLARQINGFFVDWGLQEVSEIPLTSREVYNYLASGSPIPLQIFACGGVYFSGLLDEPYMSLEEDEVMGALRERLKRAFKAYDLQQVSVCTGKHGEVVLVRKDQLEALLERQPKASDGDILEFCRSTTAEKNESVKVLG